MKKVLYRFWKNDLDNISGFTIFRKKLNNFSFLSEIYVVLCQGRCLCLYCLQCLELRKAWISKSYTYSSPTWTSETRRGFLWHSWYVYSHVCINWALRWGGGGSWWCPRLWQGPWVISIKPRYYVCSLAPAHTEYFYSNYYGSSRPRVSADSGSELCRTLQRTSQSLTQHLHNWRTFSVSANNKVRGGLAWHKPPSQSVRDQKWTCCFPPSRETKYFHIDKNCYKYWPAEGWKRECECSPLDDVDDVTTWWVISMSP